MVDCRLTYFSYALRNVYSSKIPDGYYSSVNMLVTSIQDVLKSSGDDPYYKISVDPTAKRFIVITRPPADASMTTPSLVLSPSLKRITGLQDIFTTGAHVAASAYDLFSACSSLFALCDIVRPSNFGSSMVPILLVAPFVSSNYARQQSFLPIQEHYVPLRTSSIQTLSIKLRNSLGEPFPFSSSGEIVCTLKFRPLE